MYFCSIGLRLCQGLNLDKLCWSYNILNISRFFSTVSKAVSHFLESMTFTSSSPFLALEAIVAFPFGLAAALSGEISFS